MNDRLRAIRRKMRAKGAEQLLKEMFCLHPNKVMYRNHDGYNRWACTTCKRRVLAKELS